jgi:long-chain acyl-CoA synthetase
MVDSLRAVLDVKGSYNIVSYLPLCHVAERIFSVFLTLKAGCVVNFADSIETVQEAIKEIAPDIFFAVPRIWEKMYSSIHLNIQNATRIKQLMANFFLGLGWKIATWRMETGNDRLFWKGLYTLGYVMLFRKIQDQLGLLKAKSMISGGAPISPDVLKFFYSIGLGIREVYGMTETSGVTHLNPPDRIKIGTVGLVVPGVKCRIAEEDGEILIRAPSNFVGYYRDKEATETALEGGWMHTGDIGEIDEEGYLKITDRKKDLIITAGGKNISPSEIENKLKFSPYIAQAMVIGDGKKFVSAIIQIDMENVGLWAQKKMIPYTTFKDLSGKPEVYKLIQEEVNKANKELARVENVRKFILLDKELDHDDDELTATQKIRRKIIFEKYPHYVDQIYESK